MRSERLDARAAPLPQESPQPHLRSCSVIYEERGTKKNPGELLQEKQTDK